MFRCCFCLIPFYLLVSFRFLLLMFEELSLTNDGRPLDKERFLAIGHRGETYVLSAKDFFGIVFVLFRFVCTFCPVVFVRFVMTISALMLVYVLACLVTCLRAYFLAFFITFLPSYMHACLTILPTCLLVFTFACFPSIFIAPSCLLACLPTYLLAFLLARMLDFLPPYMLATLLASFPVSLLPCLLATFLNPLLVSLLA